MKPGRLSISRGDHSLASIVIFAARSEASVYLGGRSDDSLGQVLEFQGHHLIDVNPDTVE